MTPLTSNDKLSTSTSLVERVPPELVLVQEETVSCPGYLLSIQKLGSTFRCIPFTPIVIYQRPFKVWHSIPDVLEAHKMIRDSGVQNFLRLRIPVNTKLKVSSWRRHLCDYFDKQLANLIEFGFALDFDRTRELESTFINHASARYYSEHVDKYLQEELHFEAMLGPGDVPPFNIHISPFMTREKSGSESRHTIIDLSFPKGLSINDTVAKDTYLGTKFQMHYQVLATCARNVWLLIAMF